MMKKFTPLAAIASLCLLAQACAPAFAAPVDPTKAGTAAWLLQQKAAVDALTAISTPERNYIWAAGLGAQALAEDAGATPAPLPAPTPTPTPAPIPTPIPEPAPGVTKVSSDAALTAAIKDGAKIEVAAGKYAPLNISGRKNVSITGTGGVTFGQWSKVANSSNITIAAVDFVQTSVGDANSVLLSPSNVDGLTLKAVNFIGQPGGYGFGIFAKDATTKNVRVEGGSATRLEYAFRFNQAQGLYVTDFLFTELTADGVQLGGNSRDVTVTKSTYRNWKPARGSHPDAFQMVCAAYNITFSYNDIDASVQGINQFANAAACPGVGSQNVVVEYNSFKLGTYANAVYLGNSNGRVTGNKLFKATYNPMIRISGGNVALSGNTLGGKPYP